MLLAFLDFQREEVLRKTAGLDATAARTRLPPSDLTIGGLLKHLTLVETAWFRRCLLGEPLGDPWDTVDWEADPDWEFRTGATEPPDDLRAAYVAACDRSRAAVADLDLTAVAVRPDGRGEAVSLRYVLLHLIEETARHLGHLDLLREAADGLVG